MVMIPDIQALHTLHLGTVDPHLCLSLSLSLCVGIYTYYAYTCISTYASIYTYVLIM